MPCCTSAPEGQASQSKGTEDTAVIALTRRAVLSASLASAAISGMSALPAQAVQGYTAGRIPGTALSGARFAWNSAADND